MKLSRLRIANLGRALIVAFGAQAVAAAMCLMPADAMAAPVLASGAVAMHSDVCATEHGASASHHAHARHACPHCDAPVQAVSQIDIGHGLLPPTLLAVASAPLPQPVVEAQASREPVARSLAPPDSASLIYSTNRRIRI